MGLRAEGVRICVISHLLLLAEKWPHSNFGINLEFAKTHTERFSLLGILIQYFWGEPQKLAFPVSSRDTDPAGARTTGRIAMSLEVISNALLCRRVPLDSLGHLGPLYASAAAVKAAVAATAAVRMETPPSGRGAAGSPCRGGIPSPGAGPGARGRGAAKRAPAVCSCGLQG